MPSSTVGLRAKYSIFMFAGPPSPARRRRQRFAPPATLSKESEDLPAVRRRGDGQLVAVLGHRPAGDLDPFLVQQAGQGAVGQRTFRVFGLDELLDLAFHRQRRDVFPVVAVDAAVE